MTIRSSRRTLTGASVEGDSAEPVSGPHRPVPRLVRDDVIEAVAIAVLIVCVIGLLVAAFWIH